MIPEWMDQTYSLQYHVFTEYPKMGARSCCCLVWYIGILSCCFHTYKCQIQGNIVFQDNIWYLITNEIPQTRRACKFY